MNIKGADRVFRKLTLESLTPGIFGPSSPTKVEKDQNYFQSDMQFKMNHVA
jgi:hypothetical protein